MSGVNAHMLLSVPTSNHAATEPAAVPWRRGRFWPMPQLSRLLGVVVMPRGRRRESLRLSRHLIRTAKACTRRPDFATATDAVCVS